MPVVDTEAWNRLKRWQWDAFRHLIRISGENPATVTAASATVSNDGFSGEAVTMKRQVQRWHPSLVVGIVATILLAPQAALAVVITFVLHGVTGVFRGLEIGQTTDLPPAEAWLTVTPPNNAPMGLYRPAPICLLRDCSFMSVDASGKNLTTPAEFHGVNGGWQLLIRPSPSGHPGGSVWPLYGSLFYCPGYENDGKPDQCPEPTPDTEPRSGPITPTPHHDPGDTDVPGPLPVLGLAAAFWLSRRLRARIRGSLSGSSRTGAAPRGPRREAG
jgi:hypothetical protein